MNNVNDSFSDVEIMLINMHNKKLETMISNGEMTYEVAKEKLTKLNELKKGLMQSMFV